MKKDISEIITVDTLNLKWVEVFHFVNKRTRYCLRKRFVIFMPSCHNASLRFYANLKSPLAIMKSKLISIS